MIFDILFVLFVGTGFYWGYQKGIIYSLFSLAAYFLGIVAALRFSFLLINYLHKALMLGPKVLAVIAFVLMFMLTVLLVRLVAWALEQVLKSFSLNLMNQLVGGLLYSCISLFVLSVLIWFLNKWGIFPDRQKMTSHVYPYIANLGPAVIDFSGRLIPVFRSVFHDFDELMRCS